MKNYKKVGLIFSALLLVGCGLFNATSASAYKHHLTSSSQDVSDTDSQSDSSEGDSDELSDYTQDDQYEGNPGGSVMTHEGEDSDSQLEENIDNFQNNNNQIGDYQCSKAYLRQFAYQLNPAQMEVVRASFVDSGHAELSAVLGVNQPDVHGNDIVTINKLVLINSAILVADLDLVQRVYNTFQFTDNELNEADPEVYGTPLWNAVLLTNHHTNNEVAAIVDYLLQHGANPYADTVGNETWSVPDLFAAGDASERRLFLAQTFAEHGYNILPVFSGYQLSKVQLRQFVHDLNEAQQQVIKNSFVNRGYGELLGVLNEENPGDNGQVTVCKLGLLIDAIRSADLELVQKVYNTFHFTSSELNENDLFGYGTPLWCAVFYLTDEYSHGKVIEIVNFLLNHGANPEIYYGPHQYIPELFVTDDGREQYMFIIETFANHGYDILSNL